MVGRSRTAQSRARLAVAITMVIAVSVSACGGDAQSDSSTPSTAPGLVVASLGDSFASGTGAPPYDSDSGSCQRSADGWSRQLDADSTEIVSTDHRACGGASTVHLTDGWPDRDLPPQIPTTPEPGITLVTLVIGGNDVGFSTILGFCVLSSCPSPTDPAFTDRFQALRTTLVATVYPALHAAYPNARIVHVGYPRLTPAPGQPVVNCGWLPDTDQVGAAAIMGALNDTIEASTAGQDVTYVDVTNALDGHEMCTEDPWMRNVGEASQAHPTADGHTAIELAVAQALQIEITP